LLSAKDSFDDLTKAQHDARDAAVHGSADQIAAYRKVDEQTIRSKEAVIKYAQSLGGIPPAKVTEINAMIDQGDLAGAALALDHLTRDRTAQVNIQLIGLQKLLNLGGLFHTPGFPVTSAAGNGTTPASDAFGLNALAAPSPRGGGAVGAYSPTLVVQIHAPSMGNPTHISDAVVAGYNRAVRLGGPRAVTVPASGESWTS
ncbi:MAG TPA: hypothetical protein VGM93_09090, partial [Acidimicrobiales bacterium]